MRTRKTAPALAVVVLVLLAGCSFGTAGTATPTGTSGTETPAGSVAPSTIVERSIEAIDAVETYRLNTSQSITIVANLAQEIDVRRNVSVNRTARRIHAEITQSLPTGTQNAEVYLVGGTLYQRSPTYARRFSTEWVRINASGNVSEQMSQQDALGQQRLVLNGTTLRRNGTEVIDGVETYRLETTSAPTALEDIIAKQLAGLGLGINESTYSLTDGAYTFWIATETYRPVRVSGHLNSTISVRGQSIEMRQAFRFRYEYDTPVSIELPDAAKGAPFLSNLVNASSGS